jgi:hypothetical protein
VVTSHSPTPASEPPNLRQSVASPTLKSPSLRSNSLPGLQDDTFVMPKVSTLIVYVWCACFCYILYHMLWTTDVHLWSSQMLLCSPYKTEVDLVLLTSSLTMCRLSQLACFATFCIVTMIIWVQVALLIKIAITN